MKAAFFALAALAFGGCMKIYPDPELPDIHVEWYEDCDGTPDMLITLTSRDDDTLIQRTVACETMELDVEDVKRNRYEVKGELLTPDGGVYVRAIEELDMRNGINESAYLYFGANQNFRLAWEFDMGASCASLDSEWVEIDYFSANDTLTTTDFALCINGTFVGYPGTARTVRLRATTASSQTTVAVSPRSAPFMYSADMPVDLGTLILTPCGSSCPP